MSGFGHWLPLHPQNNDTERKMAEDGAAQAQSKSTGGFTAVNGYLVTPPEEIVHSFSSDKSHDRTAQPQQWENKLPPIIQAHSPPTSPAGGLLPSLATATGFPSHDPQLYPDEQNASKTAQTPLFGQDQELAKAVAQTTLSTPDQTPERPKERPARPRIFPEILGVTSPQQALDYYYCRTAELRSYSDAVNKLPSPRKTTSVASRQDFDQQQLHKITRPAGVTKTRPVSRQTTKPKAAAAASPDKPLPPRKRTPKARTLHDFVDSAFPSASQPAKHKRAPPSKKIEDHNVSWTELQDFAPPTSTLDNSGKVLKANWNGSTLDLTADPNRNHLHPQEIHIASVLRLTGQQYLFNKRKIFQARLQALKDGKNFTKTAAQGACSIDVNKASQLWEAFDRVGWFKETLFEQYM